MYILRIGTTYSKARVLRGLFHLYSPQFAAIARWKEDTVDIIEKRLREISGQKKVFLVYDPHH